jgi:hypothetical protein
VEQIRDEIRVEAEVGEGTRTVTPRRRAAPPPAAIEASTEDPPLDDEAGPDPAPAVQAELQVAYVEDDGVEVVVEEAPKAPVAGGITPAQSRMLHALLRDTGRTDRDVALVYISGVLGREVESTKELTKADAGRVIDALNTNVEPLLDEEA